MAVVLSHGKRTQIKVSSIVVCLFDILLSCLYNLYLIFLVRFMHRSRFTICGRRLCFRSNLITFSVVSPFILRQQVRQLRYFNDEKIKHHSLRCQ